jgi:hypothetical protein
VEKDFDFLPKRFLRRLEPEQPVALKQRHPARHDVERDETSNDEDWVHGSIFFVIEVIVVFVQIVFDIVEFVHRVVARAIAIFIAPVAMGAYRADDHDSMIAVGITTPRATCAKILTYSRYCVFKKFLQVYL